MKNGDLIFVYGTLRPGQHAASTMERGAKHLQTTRIFAHIYDLGAYPGVKLIGLGDPSPAETVVGDLFEIVDDQLPSELDSYEGYPYLYDRTLVPTECGRDAWVYTYNGYVSESQQIQSGDWVEKRSVAEPMAAY